MHKLQNPASCTMPLLPCTNLKSTRNVVENDPYSYAPTHTVPVTPIPDQAPSVVLSSPYSDAGVGILQEPQHVFTMASTSPRLTDRENSPELTSALIHCFLDKFREDHFFYLPEMSINNSSETLRSLSITVILWATYLGADSIYPEERLLALAVSNAARDSTTLDHASNHQTSIQLIQTHILLSLYFLDHAIFMQGRHHCGIATSLAFGIGLHHLNAQLYAGPVPPQFLRNMGSRTPSLATSTDELTMLSKAFWAVVTLNHYWVAITGTPSHLPFDAIPVISTHQPTNNMDHILTQASICLQRIVAFTATAGYPPPEDDSRAFADELEAFTNTVLLPVGNRGGPTLTLSHLFIHAAVLQLHAPYSNHSMTSNTKCWAAGEHMLACLAHMTTEQTASADIIIAPLLAVFAEFYLKTPNASTTANVQRILAALDAFSKSKGERSTLIRICIANIQAEAQFFQVHGMY
ncbi:hypothetical protein MIND_01317600 [Mycena indigotica]|uniref:Transcription factor domain-containing protein n=1 Tax=Mycena indigotica TaxID=2126181 RepID=A0A8H6S1L2_9AGAR|nr:uncharacterized protein MIND_01317600 [Mycena indigotica]KAF7290767.1 hypothetical protein MIND_01317600 [Mycena indigotica]